MWKKKPVFAALLAAAWNLRLGLSADVLGPPETVRALSASRHRLAIQGNSSLVSLIGLFAKTACARCWVAGIRRASEKAFFAYWWRRCREYYSSINSRQVRSSASSSAYALTAQRVGGAKVEVEKREVRNVRIPRRTIESKTAGFRQNIVLWPRSHRRE